MKPFYSILKFSPNSRTSDSLGVGFIVSDGEKFHFMHSPNKLGVAKKLSEGAPKQIDFAVNEISATISQLNKQIEKNRSGLFEKETFFTQSYFDYLNSYSHGLLQFTEPKTIADELDEEKINKLFELFIDKIPVKVKKEEKVNLTKFRRKIETNLIRRVEKRVHVNQVFNAQTTPILLADYTLDCIGKNGSLIGAKSIPFNKGKAALNRDISTFINIAAHLSRKYSDIREDRFFLVADEPKNRTSDLHHYYSEIRKNEKLLKVISSDDAAEVAELIEEKNAQMFLEV